MNPFPKINSARWIIFWAGILLLGVVTNTKATFVTLDPGAIGTNTSFIQDFSILNTVAGSGLNGQSQSLDIFFTNSEFLVAAGFNGLTVDLFINQSGPLGTWPTNPFTVTGYLMDAAGNPLSTPASFPDSGTMPAQIWPDWPYYLPNGTQYLPETKIYESLFPGTLIYGNPNGYYVNPITFSGIHLNITYPTGPTNTVLGGRIVMSGSLYVSPNPAPQYTDYFVFIPNPQLTMTGPYSSGSSNSQAFGLQLSGTPYYPYIFQSTTNLISPINWHSFITNSADSNGNWNLTITNSTSIPQRFFQVVAWPGHPQQ
jgi:hypothetical protein